MQIHLLRGLFMAISSFDPKKVPEAHKEALVDIRIAMAAAAQWDEKERVREQAMESVYDLKPGAVIPHTDQATKVFDKMGELIRSGRIPLDVTDKALDDALKAATSPTKPSPGYPDTPEEIALVNAALEIINTANGTASQPAPATKGAVTPITINPTLMDKIFPPTQPVNPVNKTKDDDKKLNLFREMLKAGIKVGPDKSYQSKLSDELGLKGSKQPTPIAGLSTGLGTIGARLLAAHDTEIKSAIKAPAIQAAFIQRISDELASASSRIENAHNALLKWESVPGGKAKGITDEDDVRYAFDSLSGDVKKILHQQVEARIIAEEITTRTGAVKYTSFPASHSEENLHYAAGLAIAKARRELDEKQRPILDESKGKDELAKIATVVAHVIMETKVAPDEATCTKMAEAAAIAGAKAVQKVVEEFSRPPLNSYPGEEAEVRNYALMFAARAAAEIAKAPGKKLEDAVKEANAALEVELTKYRVTRPAVAAAPPPAAFATLVTPPPAVNTHAAHMFKQLTYPSAVIPAAKSSDLAQMDKMHEDWLQGLRKAQNDLIEHEKTTLAKYKDNLVETATKKASTTGGLYQNGSGVVAIGKNFDITKSIKGDHGVEFTVHPSKTKGGLEGVTFTLPTRWTSFPKNLFKREKDIEAMQKQAMKQGMELYIQINQDKKKFQNAPIPITKCPPQGVNRAREAYEDLSKGVKEKTGMKLAHGLEVVDTVVSALQKADPEQHQIFEKGMKKHTGEEKAAETKLRSDVAPRRSLS